MKTFDARRVTDSVAALVAAGLVISGPATAQPGVSPPLPAAARVALTTDQIAGIVETIAVAGQERYVDAAQGAKLANHLRQRLAAGAYAKLTNPLELGAVLTKDMREAVRDVHLRAIYEPGRVAANRVMVAPGAQSASNGAAPRNLVRIDGRANAEIARTNYGFDRLERLDGNVGYMKLSQFIPSDLSQAPATAAMAFLGDTDAMIVDLRGNRGGSPDAVARLISYFVGDKPVRLFASYNRATDTTDEILSLTDIPGRRRTGQPLYVLQDSGTASAAEMFGYIVQRQKLGQVVGATSAGAGNGGSMVPLGSDMYFFLPQRRTLDGPGWEGVGVKPDVAVAPDAAFDVAYRAALETLAVSAADPQVKREREWALELLKANQDLNDQFSTAVGEFVGRYGSRRFEARDGKLTLVAETGRAQGLTRVGADVFRGAGGRFTFIRGEAGRVEAVDVETLTAGASRSARVGG